MKALVCGASKGIGRAIALEFKSLGWEVLALARSESELASLGVPFKSVDFSSPSSVQSVLSELPSDFDVLVCNSGGPQAGPLASAEITDFQSAFQQHLFTNHLLMQKCLSHMKAKKFGRIITILSTSVKAPLPNLGVSNTLRAAMASWAKTLAMELGPFGITVNNVLPGATETERLAALLSQAAQKRGVSKELVEKEWLSAIPAGRFASPTETAKAVAFLAGPDAAYINGINLPVDGGRLNSL